MLPENGDPKREDPYLRREWAGAAEDGGRRGEQGNTVFIGGGAPKR